MTITFLGTGTSQGIPVVVCECPVCQSNNPKDKRLRTSIAVEVDGLNIIIDTGPDFRQQMLRGQIERLDAVVFTHAHKDHIAGLDDVRGFNFKQKSAIEVYASLEVQEVLKREFQYIFSGDNYPGIPRINLHTINNQPFQIKGTKIIPIEVLHYKLPVLGFRIQDFTYITDANFISEEEKEKIKNSKVLVLNALRREKHVSHFTFDEAAALFEELKPGKGYITHISHQLGFHDEISKELPDFIELAYDGLKVEV